MKKIIYYYNGKKIVGTRDSKLEAIPAVDCEEISYSIDGIEVSEYIYKDVKNTIKHW